MGSTRPRRASSHSLRFRILAAFLAAMTAMLSALVFLMVQYQGVSQLQGLVTEGYLPLELLANQLAAEQQRIETDIGRLLREDRRPGTGAESLASIYGDRLQQTLDDSIAQARTAARMTTSPEETAALNRVLVHLERSDKLVEGWLVLAQQFVHLSETGQRAAAATLAESLMQDRRAVSEELEQLSRLLDDRIQAVIQATDRKRRSANAVALGLTTAALILSVTMIVAVLYALHPIGRLTAQIQRLAEGDYSGAPVQVRGGDEIAVLAAEFNRMVRALQLRDRTLVERAEQLNRLSRYLGSVLDSLEDGLFVVEAGVVTVANPAAKRLWSLQQDEPPPPPAAAWVAEVGHHEAHVGTAVYEIRVHPFGDNGVVVVASEVTEQRRALEQLARSERLALVGQMLAQITHEVRNPLNALSLNAEMLSDELSALDGARRSEAWDLLATIVGEIERLTRVTEHYLQLARRPPARLRAEDLGGLVQDVVRLVGADLERQGVTVEVRCAALPRQLVDGNQLRQALLNVVRNAAEAGAKRLEIGLGARDEEVRIEIRDDGPGMTEEEVERAFDPFFSTKAAGTGLGLAITRQILEDHGGTIRVESAPDRGTALVLVVPVRPAPDTAELSDPPPAEP